MTIEEQKKKMRNEIKARAEGLTDNYCIQSDAMIYKSLISLDEYKKAWTIFCFVGTKDEIDTIPIIKDALKKGKRVGIPRCIEKGVMEVFCLDSLEHLVTGRYGILEPFEDALLIPPEDIELAIVPCLSCSRDGKRLGYGGGYYDRYLTKTGAYRVILCREEVMREDIPMDTHDQIMDCVISEIGIIR